MLYSDAELLVLFELLASLSQLHSLHILPLNSADVLQSKKQLAEYRSKLLLYSLANDFCLPDLHQTTLSES